MGEIRRDQFAHAVQVSTGLELDTEAVQLIFRIFDVNLNNKLDEYTRDYFHNFRFIIFPILLFINRHRVPLGSEKEKVNLGVMWTILLGSFATKLAAVFTYPFDRVKALCQVSPLHIDSMTKSFRNIFTQEGYKGFYDIFLE